MLSSAMGMPAHTQAATPHTRTFSVINPATIPLPTAANLYIIDEDPAPRFIDIAPGISWFDKHCSCYQHPSLAPVHR